MISGQYGTTVSAKHRAFERPVASEPTASAWMTRAESSDFLGLKIRGFKIFFRVIP